MGKRNQLPMHTAGSVDGRGAVEKSLNINVMLGLDSSCASFSGSFSVWEALKHLT